MKNQLLTSIFIAILFLNLTSAVVIDSVFADDITPGNQGTIRIEVENILDDEVNDFTITLNFDNLPFIPIGTSEQTIDEIDEDDDEDFVFTVKASPTITPGDYQIPYTLTYEYNSEQKTRTGSIGIRVTANPSLSYAADAEDAIIGKQGTIRLQIINKGFSDARFVSVRILPERFTLLSENQIYIGEIESDDFETINIDAVFTERNPRLGAVIEYINFENEKVIENIDLPLTVYTQERAEQLGLVQRSNTGTLVFGVIALILIIVLWRIIKKQRRRNRSKRKE